MNEKLQARFLQLPKALQNAITSADVEKKLRGLSETHKLHLDQWQKLENEVMLALLGFQRVENLETNIKNEVGIADEEAKALAVDIADTIFEPIREELERELVGTAENAVDSGQVIVDRREGQNRQVAEKSVDSEQLTPVEQAGSTRQAVDREVSQPIVINRNLSSVTSAQTIVENIPSRPVEVKVVPPVASTPPVPPPTAKSVRATLSPAYAVDTKSHERKTIDDDPYRESIT